MKNVMTYKGFLGSVEYTDEDKVFHGKVEGIDGLLSFEGNTVDSLRKDFERTVEDYLDLCRKVGKSPERSYKGSFNIRIPPELHRSADRKAAEMKMTLNQFVRKAIEDEIQNGGGHGSRK